MATAQAAAVETPTPIRLSAVTRRWPETSKIDNAPRRPRKPGRHTLRAPPCAKSRPPFSNRSSPNVQAAFQRAHLSPPDPKPRRGNQRLAAPGQSRLSHPSSPQMCASPSAKRGRGEPRRDPRRGGGALASFTSASGLAPFRLGAIERRSTSRFAGQEKCRSIPRW